MAVNAYQQHTIYFTEYTKGRSAKFGQKGYIYGNTDTTSVVMANTANALVSYPIGYKSSTKAVPRNHFAGKKVMVGMDVTTAYADVVAILAVEFSYDGTNWDHDNAVTVVADTTPNVTGVKVGLADLSSIYAAYFRIVFNSSGLNVGTSGKAKLFYAIPVPDGV